TVDALGPGVTRFRLGEPVMGLVGGGGYAEEVVAAEADVVPVPALLPLEAAAAVPEAFITAHDALFSQLALAAGETLLVHAVGSGVGTAGLQLAKAVGARVLGTGRGAGKLEAARELGLDAAVQVGAGQDWTEAVLRETGGRGVDAILDLVGGDYLRGNIRVLAPRGRLIIVGLVAGRCAELDMGGVLSKRLRIMGTALRSRTPAEKAATTAAFAADVLPLLAQGKVRPILDMTFPPQEAARAHERMEANENFGKIVIRWTG
ncbi:MAG TPA: zinc-binding dehydrogenase, partial [Longimicrobiales bacterium]